MERETEGPCRQASRYNSNTLLINIMNFPSLQYTRGGESGLDVSARRVQTGRSVGLLVGLVVGHLNVWLVGRFVGKLVGWSVGCSVC